MMRPMSQRVPTKLKTAHVSRAYPETAIRAPYAGRMSWRCTNRVTVSGWGLRDTPMYLPAKDDARVRAALPGAGTGRALACA